MARLLGIVLPLALGAAVSPTLLAMQLVTLSRKTAPLPRSWALAAGCAVVLAAFAVLALLVAKSTGGSSSPSEAGAIVKLVAAALLVVIGLRQLRKQPAPPRPEHAAKHPLRGAFLVGAALMLVNFSSIVLFFPAMHEIGISHVGLGGKVVAFLLLYTITLLPALGPPLLVTLGGARATHDLERLDRFFGDHSRAIGSGICFLFSALLAVAGFKVLLCALGSSRRGDGDG
jgi:Sap, sulfolipid-1-addressing protein